MINPFNHVAMKHSIFDSDAATMDDLAGPFAFYSPEIKHEFLPAHYADRFGCTGQNLSPALAWMNRPDGTICFAITVFDPDAPGGGFWHWLAYNLSPVIESLPVGAGEASGVLLPEGSLQGRNDAGTIGYFGPCPPGGQRHRYQFTLFACRRMIHPPKHANGFAIERELDKVMIDRSSFTVYGERSSVGQKVHD